MVSVVTGIGDLTMMIVVAGCNEKWKIQVHGQRNGDWCLRDL